MLVKGVPDHSRISHVWNSGVAGVAGVQEFRSSGVQEFRSSGVQEFRSSAERCPLKSSFLPSKCSPPPASLFKFCNS
jgi:hypothetical protein